MAVYSKQLFSGSTNGKPILVTANVTPGTLIHTAVTGTTGFDEIYLRISNNLPLNIPITVEFGGATPGDWVCSGLVIPANSGPIQIINGDVLQNAQIVRVIGSGITCWGYVNRIQ